MPDVLQSDASGEPVMSAIWSSCLQKCSSKKEVTSIRCINLRVERLKKHRLLILANSKYGEMSLISVIYLATHNSCLSCHNEDARRWKLYKGSYLATSEIELTILPAGWPASNWSKIDLKNSITGWSDQGPPAGQKGNCIQVKRIDASSLRSMPLHFPSTCYCELTPRQFDHRRDDQHMSLAFLKFIISWCSAKKHLRCCLMTETIMSKVNSLV